MALPTSDTARVRSTTRPAEETKANSPRRAAFTGFVGTTIEWYDYYIFGTATALVFNSQFFPALDPLTATLASFATFSVAFLARPLGGALFGHFGDRIGRKKMLVYSLLGMGFATLLVGFLPTYPQIGIWAPIILVACRFVQGVAVGGEWGGGVLMALEHAPPGKRAFYASWPQCGVPAGTVLSSGAFFLVQLMPEDVFLSWGWRLPFFASAALVLVGLYIRLKVTESPDFVAAAGRGERVKIPAAEIFRWHKKPLVIGMLVIAASSIVFYLTTVFMLSYGSTTVGYSRGEIFACLMVAALLQVFTMPALAVLADRTNKRRMVVVSAAVVALTAFPIFWLFNTHTVVGLLLSLILALPIAHAVSYGIVSSFIAELFPTNVRFSGSSLAYQFGGIVTMAPVPFVATLLVAKFDTTTAVSAYIVGAALVTALVAAWTPRTPRD
jgi:metabolite-proton symporter